MSRTLRVSPHSQRQRLHPNVRSCTLSGSACPLDVSSCTLSVSSPPLDSRDGPMVQRTHFSQPTQGGTLVQTEAALDNRVGGHPTLNLRLRDFHSTTPDVSPFRAREERLDALAPRP